MIIMLAAMVLLWPPLPCAEDLAAGRAPAQREFAAETRLDIGFGTAKPGTEVVLPIVLEVPPGVQVGKTISEIAFPSSLLTFKKAVPGVAADLAAATVKADVRSDPKQPDTSILTVTVTSAGKAISGGIVASLSFTLSVKAPDRKVVALVHRPSAFTTGSEPRAVEPIAGRNGEIEIGEGAPVIACFFYMH